MSKCYDCREARYRCPHGFHYEIREGYRPQLLGCCADLPVRYGCPECEPSARLKGALLEARAGLEFAVSRYCGCSDGFRCSPHVALDAVRSALREAA